MESFKIIAFLLPATCAFAMPAASEAILDQARIKPFSVRATSFDHRHYKNLDGLVALPSMRNEEEEVQAPGQATWQFHLHIIPAGSMGAVEITGVPSTADCPELARVW